jgi:hypothetical protein
MLRAVPRYFIQQDGGDAKFGSADPISQMPHPVPVVFAATPFVK